MSSVFGIYNRCGQKVDLQNVAAMHTAMSSWGPDVSKQWCDDEVALGHEMLWNTPESHHEHLPLVGEHVVLSMDARLDNREELVGLFGVADSDMCGVPDSDMCGVPDSEFVIRAYAKWGEECPKYLVGDFSFALWDKVKKQFFCARDHLGVKPFYFYLVDERFVFASDLRGLVAHPDISRTLDDEAVANYLVHGLLIDTCLTFFKDIHKLPAANSLTVSATTVQQCCYWRPEDSPKIVLPDAEAYAKRLRELLEEAVYCRMRSRYSLTSHLSGGLDSSSIAILAARKLREKHEKLFAFNWVHEPEGDDDLDHFEWASSKEIADAEGIDHSYVPITSNDIYVSMSGHNLALGDSASFWYECVVRDAVQAKGSRVILSGWGGDELSTYHGQSYMVNLFKNADVVHLYRELKARTAKQKKPLKVLLRVLYDEIFLPCLPRSLYHKMPRSVTPERSSFMFVQPSFMPIILREKGKPRLLTMQPQVTIRDHMLAFLHHGHLQARMESWGASAHENRLEYRYPLLDKRIVEFILGVPSKYFMDKGVGRYLFRLATRGVLPDDKLWYHPKVEAQRVMRLVQMCEAAYKKIVHDMMATRKDERYVDMAKIEESLDLSLGEGVDSDFIPEVGVNIQILLCEKVN